MSQLSRVAFIGNSLPRRCGIATFTANLEHAVATSGACAETAIVAMTDHGRKYDYPPVVRFEVNDNKLGDYYNAADFLNGCGFDVACLQHEFGIFGGEAGRHILTLLSHLTMPVITTLHTVLSEPTAAQRAALAGIVDVSAKVVVMAEKGRMLLRSVYDVPGEKIEIIPHGIPSFALIESDDAKARFGFGGRTVILTFGLLSPGKGIEVMIDAMPSILKRIPDAVYVVLGATHPNLVLDEGEAYRESLAARVRELRIEEHVAFLDQFVDQSTLLAIISMCDVYVTPYLNESQMTSGTLAYSFGLGKPVVSTPYWHARELLADGRGVLVPFGDAKAIGDEITALLTNDARRMAMRKRAYTYSRAMTWERTGERYLAAFKAATATAAPKVIVRLDARSPPRGVSLPDLRTHHFLSMCDDTGLFQHAVHSVADRSHGYCVDDNARALLLACVLNEPGEQRLSEALTGRLAAFVQHAWNPDTERFRNFMSFDRRWLEDIGSEDSHGRCLWALGECARSDANPSRRNWAAALFTKALPTVEAFRSPRAWAFTLLGLDAFCATVAQDADAARFRLILADRLLSLLSATESKDWVWFEDGLAYDNARLSQALILTGRATGSPAYVAAGLRSLRWLMALQTTATGHFRPVGSESFGQKRTPPIAFDQQPLEATATISACLAAWRADGEGEWRTGAARAFAWFLGSNDLSLPLVDVDSGSCRDGLHRDRANENRGAESVLSYLFSLAEVRKLARGSGELLEPAPRRAGRV